MDDVFNVFDVFDDDEFLESWHYQINWCFYEVFATMILCSVYFKSFMKWVFCWNMAFENFK